MDRFVRRLTAQTKTAPTKSHEGVVSEDDRGDDHEHPSTAGAEPWVLGRDLPSSTQPADDEPATADAPADAPGSPTADAPADAGGPAQEPRSTEGEQAHRTGFHRVVLALAAAVASVVAVVSAGLMLVSEQLASSAWPLVLAVVATLAGGCALFGWWRQGLGESSMSVSDSEEALPL